MLDRLSEHPGRVRLTPVEGQPGVYDMEWADDPQVEGMPLNKENLLQDQTARMLGLDPEPATPDDALRALASRSDESTFQKLMLGRLF